MQNAYSAGGLKGVSNSLAFGITKTDIGNIEKYNSLIKSGVTSQTAWYKTMQTSSQSAQELVSAQNGAIVSTQGLTIASKASSVASKGNESEDYMMENIFEKMNRDITYKQYESYKEELVKALNDTDVSPQRIANLQYLIKSKKKDLIEILDFYIDKDLSATDGRIGYLMASESERKYMNPDGTADLSAISELCDKIDEQFGKEVATDGRE